MTVLDRLALICDASDVPLAYWGPASLRPYRSVLLKRISAAGAALNINHLWRRANEHTQREVVAAIKLMTPEMEWLRRLAS